MSDSTIRDLLRSLEQTIRDRFRVIEDVLRSGKREEATAAAAAAAAPAAAPLDPIAMDQEGRLRRIEGEILGVKAMMTCVPEIITRIQMLEKGVADLATSHAADPYPAPPAAPVSKEEVLVSRHPLIGIEVIPTREVVISAEDRLLMTSEGRAAVEAEEGPTIQSAIAEEMVDQDMDSDEEGEVAEETTEVIDTEEVDPEEEVEEEAVEEVEEEAVEEGEAEEAEEAEEELELEEFEYKGSTYYRDGENNVYMVDEDGDLIQEPVGVWNPAKQKVLVRKS